MAWDNSTYPKPGDLADQDTMNALTELWLYLKGVQAGQTEIDSEAPFQLDYYIESTGSGSLGIRKRDASTVHNVYLGLEMQDEPALADGDYIEIHGDLGVSGGAAATYSQLVADRVGMGSGRLRLQTIHDLMATVFTITPEGLTGATEAPGVEFDIPAGAVNVSGGFYQGGILITDWTFTGGSPNKVSKTGNARTVGSMVSSAATGTAPFPVSSTTECPYVDADLLDDHAWHSGIFASGYYADVGSSDTATSATVDLDKAGKWEIWARGTHFNNALADQGKTWNAKIKTAGGTQIGATAEVTLEQWSTLDERSEVKSWLLMGSYTASGVTTVRVEVAVVSGSGSANYSSASILAIWAGP